MPKTKDKREAHTVLKALPFAMVWTLASVLSALATAAFWLTEPLGYLTPAQIVIVSILRAAPLTAFFQVLLVERLFKRSMRGWMLYTLLAALVTLPLMLQPPAGLTPSLILFAPTALFQTLWLWRRVNKAWIWPLLSGNTAFALYFLLPTSIRSQLLNLSIPIGLALLSGFVMHYLLTHPKDDEKTKNDFVSDEDSSSDYARIERLQESDQHTPLWDVGDDQMRHSEA